MVKYINRAALLLCISFLSFFSATSYAQEQDGGGLDNKKVHYGIHWGFVDNRVDIYYSDINGVARPLEQGKHSFYAPGTRINVMYDIRLGRCFSLRAMPGLLVYGCIWKPDDNAVLGSPSVEYKVKSVSCDLSVDVKFHPFRWGDRQLYLSSGLSYVFDFSSLNKEIDEGTIQRLNAHDLRYTCGVGYGFSTKHLRLGVELKATFGLPSPDKVDGKRPNTFYHHSGPTFGFGFTIEA